MGLDIMKGQSHPSINSINDQGLHRNHWNAKSVLDWADPWFSCRSVGAYPIRCVIRSCADGPDRLLRMRASASVKGFARNRPTLPSANQKNKKRKKHGHNQRLRFQHLYIRRVRTQDGTDVPAIAPSYIYVPSYFGTLDLKTQTLDSTLVAISCDLLLFPGKKQAFCFYFLVFPFFENPRNLAQLPFPLSKP